MLNKFQANNVIAKIAERADTETNNRWDITLRVGSELKLPVGYIIQHETDNLFLVVSHIDSSLSKGKEGCVFPSLQKARAALIPSMIEASSSFAPAICNAMFEKLISFADHKIKVSGVSPFEVTLHYVELNKDQSVTPEVFAKNYILGNIGIYG